MSLRSFTIRNSLDDIAEAFGVDGFVHLCQPIGAGELAALQDDTRHVIESDRAAQQPAIDYFHDPDPATGGEVFHRVQYVLPKGPGRSMVRLMGHPFILNVARRLLGDDLLCVAEALVFKLPGNGRQVPVHADCDPADPRLAPVIFNVDYYLDDSTVENGCLLVSPGSHRVNQSAGDIGRRGFGYPGLVPVEVRAGDVVIHNIRVVHGSHRSTARLLRRTLYYEFHSLAALLKQGGPRPGYAATPQWIRDRVRLLMHAIKDRRHAAYAAGETPFEYQPPTGFEPGSGTAETVNLRPALGIDKYF